MRSRTIPDEVLYFIAMLRTGEMRRALSNLEDEAAAGDEEAEELRQALERLLQQVDAIIAGRDHGPLNIQPLVHALYRRMH
jgi:hypothetical protein